MVGRCSSVEHMSCALPRYFGKLNEATPLLSVVVPVGPLVGRMTNLLSWIAEIQSYSAQVILVVDEKSDGTYTELLKKLLMCHSIGLLKLKGELKYQLIELLRWIKSLKYHLNIM